MAREFLSSAARLNLLPPAFVSASPPTVRAQRPLELFFPFDPYLLRSSAARLKLEGSYLRWSSRPGAAAPEASPPEGEPPACVKEATCAGPAALEQLPHRKNAHDFREAS